MKKYDLKKINGILIFIVLSGVVIHYFHKYLLFAIMPFVFAWGIAVILRTPARFISEKTKISPKIASCLTASLFFIFAFSASFFLFASLWKEISDIYRNFISESVKYIRHAEQISENVYDLLLKTPVIGNAFFEKFDSKSVILKLGDCIERFLPEIATFLGSIVAKIASGIPYIVLFLFVTIISVFYFSIELEKIDNFAKKLFSKKETTVLFIIKDEIISVLFGYIRAYSFIILMTFTELFIGLSIIGEKYALLISFFTAIIDILPILGAGTVLIPWGIVLIVTNNFKTGIGVLVLYLAITIIRQIAEPKIVGSFLGLHPLCALMAMYIGLRVAGIFGIFIFPFAAVVAKNVCKRTLPTATLS